VREQNGQTALFCDTFTNYYDPEIGEAAVAVLGAAGVTCSLAPNVCCGRPLISQGMLEPARALAQRNANLLAPLAEQGKPILFCEPSCLTAIKEDAPSLLRGDARKKALAVAAQSFLWEEWVESQCGGKIPLRAGPEEILLHGHCHQKALGLVGASKSLLSRIPGAKVVDLDAGCCGMAGSFGYVKRRYEVSQAIAERKLLPAVRELKAHQAVAAAGTSCRHQVFDFAGVRAQHPAVLLAGLLQK
jgi:Fe-S oxidoreductase